MNRRGFLKVLGIASVAAPSIIKATTHKNPLPVAVVKPARLRMSMQEQMIHEAMLDMQREEDARFIALVNEIILNGT